MVANFCSQTPKGQYSTFSEHGHFAYQIKWNREGSNMQAHILSLHTPSTPTLGGVKDQNIFFSESSHVASQIRREWSIEHHASTHSVLTHTLCPWRGVKGQNIFFFLKVVNLSCCIYHIKWKIGNGA